MSLKESFFNNKPAAAVLQKLMGFDAQALVSVIMQPGGSDIQYTVYSLVQVQGGLQTLCS